MDIIDINLDQQQFFISLSMQGGHTFIMLGTYVGNTVQHLLCRVGKVVNNNQQETYCNGMQSLFNVVFSHENAILIDERTSRSTYGHHPISYQAYDITYSQYLEFVHLLEELQQEDNKFYCFKQKERKGKVVTLEKTCEPLFNNKKDIGTIKDKVSELNLHNTCRHTAINLVEQVQHVPVSSYVSSTFFRKLPYQTALDFGSPSEDIPFYVLPVSPAAYSELERHKLSVLKKLYGRMEELLMIAPNADETIEKFNLLKNLYLTLLGPQKELTLSELLDSIHQWKEENKPAISVLRQTYFWDSLITRVSKTEALINTIEADLKSQVSTITLGS